MAHLILLAEDYKLKFGNVPRNIISFVVKIFFQLLSCTHIVFSESNSNIFSVSLCNIY